jgi:tetratricopeptide (TPR) repeat protein
LCYEGRDFPASLDYIERTFELDPWIAVNYARKATMLGHLDRWPEAIEAAEKGVQLDPSLEFLHVWLMEAYQKVGRPDDSRRERRLLERMRAAK